MNDPSTSGALEAVNTRYQRVLAVFLRSLGLIYLLAFASYWVQFPGLIGAEGISPAQDFLTFIAHRRPGALRFIELPTLAWISSSDFALHLQFLFGCFAATGALFGRFPTATLLCCWALYLSLSTIGQDFFRFQWDSLLLESGLLAVVLAWQLRKNSQTSRVGVFLLRWLLFRLMLGSGLAKVLSGDTSWLQLTALTFHYETQPLPTPIGYYLHHAPSWFHSLSVALTLVIELLVPFFIWLSRAARQFAGVVFILFQTLIFLSGNYGFFNLLTIVICILLFTPTSTDSRANTFRAFKKSPLGIVLLLISTSVFLSGHFGAYVPSTIHAPGRWLSQYHVANRYGLFAGMTTQRFEISLEGSDDLQEWQSYRFSWKPDAPHRSPPLVAPHMPRLDWQMWFAALGPANHSPWLLALTKRLLEGSPNVARLLPTEQAFTDRPPRYIRALLYRYRFTRLFEQKTELKWWDRELVGLYFPPVELDPSHGLRLAEPG